MPKTMPLTIEETDDLVIIKKDGVEIDLGPNHSVVVHTDGDLHPMTEEFGSMGSLLPRADVLAKLRALHEKGITRVAGSGVVVAETTLPRVGQKMRDGSIFAGLIADGTQRIYAMPKDLDITMTFNRAAKAVGKLNARKYLGHDDWQIPALDNLHILRKNQNEGTLNGTFKTASFNGLLFPVFYWSSTENHRDSSYVQGVRFSDGYETWDRKDSGRLSCRPVRLVPAAAPSLG
jgi:hypothetical protein